LRIWARLVGEVPFWHQEKASPESGETRRKAKIMWKTITATAEAGKFLWAMHKWKTGRVPSFFHRKLLVRYVEQAKAETRTTMDMMFGPSLPTCILDKARRRKMAVWSAKSAMSLDEKMDCHIRMLDKLTKQIEAVVNESR
jgi:hypothetical protein